MRILFVTPYFPPEVGSSQIRIYELAVRLAKQGHQISVLTSFPNFPTGVVPSEWRGHLFWKGQDNGIKVHRVWTYVVPNRGFLKRILSHLSFAFCASCVAPLVPRCDVIFVDSPPLFNGIAALLLSVFKRAPFVFNVADLWPESAIQMGMLKNRPLIWLSRQLELLIYRRAALVLAITGGIYKQILADGIDASKVVLFRNSVDSALFSPHHNGAEVRRELGISDQDFVVLYAGTMGLAHDLSLLLATAAKFKDTGNDAVKFILAGDGAEKQALMEKAQAMQLHNVLFPSVFPKERMPNLLNGADCIAVSLRDLEIFRGALPTKIFEGMACAKPIVMAVSGEAADLLNEAQAGRCVAPGDPDAMHDGILSILKNPEEARRMGARGREYVVEHFSRDRRATELSHLMEQLATARQARICSPPTGGVIMGRH